MIDQQVPARRLRMLAAGAVLALPFIGTTAVPGHAANTADVPLISGQLLDGEGDPLVDADVLVRAESDAPDGGSIGTVIARGTTDDNGRFALATGDGQPGSLNPDGSVRLEITAITTDLVRHYLINAMPPTAANGAWTWPSVADETITDPNSTASPSDLPGSEIADLALRIAAGEPVAMNSSVDTLESPEPPDAGSEATETDETADSTLDGAATTTGTMGALNTATVAVAIACSAGEGSTYWTGTSTYKVRMIPIHWNEIANNTKSKYSWQTTSKTVMQAAYAGTGANYAGGFSFSTENDNAAGLAKTVDADYSKHLLKVQWKYQKQEQYCFNAGYPYKTGEVRWVPHHWTLGSQSGATSWSFQCYNSNRVEIAADTWVSRTTSSTYGGAFAIAGVELSSRQTNSSSHRHDFLMKNGSTAAYLCGNGADPGVASFAKEVYHS